MAEVGYVLSGLVCTAAQAFGAWSLLVDQAEAETVENRPATLCIQSVPGKPEF